ncbi:MAG: HAD family hydrolase [Thermomicrobiales bacterium]
MITCVTFDADGTLLDFLRLMRASLAYTLESLRASLPGPASAALTVDRMIAIRDQVADEATGRGISMEHIRLLAFERTLESISAPNPDLAARLTTVYLERRFGHIELYSDVLPALDALAGRYRLGLLSNGNSYPERCGLAGRFDFAFFAQGLGVAKPDPRFYELAAAAARCPADQFVHVGDSLSNDVAAAQSAEMLAVWLNRDGIANHSAIQPDAEIATLDELPTVVERLDLEMPASHRGVRVAND